DEAGDYKLFHQSFPIQFHEIAPSESSRAGEILGIRIGTISTFHRPESLALHVTDSAGTTLVYTSDTGYSTSVAEFARNVDQMILECSFWRDKPSPKHLELDDAMRMAQIANPRLLLLNHLYAEWDGIDLESKARRLWPGNTMAAHDGLRLEIE